MLCLVSFKAINANGDPLSGAAFSIKRCILDGAIDTSYETSTTSDDLGHASFNVPQGADIWLYSADVFALQAAGGVKFHVPNAAFTFDLGRFILEGLTQAQAAAALEASDADLTVIAALSPSNDDVIQRKAGAWVNRSMSQVKTDLALVKADVGLGNVDNTSDATKNAATATLTNKTLTSPVVNTPTGIVKGDVGLGNVDNTSDASKPVSTATQTALDLKQTAGADLVGTVTNDNAAAGEVGELLTASLASGSATSLVTATAKTIISLSLTAGDWDVFGSVQYIPDGTTTTAYVQQGISQTDNTLGGEGTFTSSSGGNLSGTVLGSLISENVPAQRISLAETTTVYLIGKASFAVSTLTAYGSIFARRRR